MESEKEWWSVDVLLGSSSAKRSLNMKIRMIIGDEKVEMNLSKFALLR